jgi:hypothetical protein
MGHSGKGYCGSSGTRRFSRMRAAARKGAATGAALPLVAALLRAGQPEMLAQRIEQRGARIEIDGIAPSLDREPYVLARRRCLLRRRVLERRWGRVAAPVVLRKSRRDVRCVRLSQSSTTRPPRQFQTDADVAISRGHDLPHS